MIQGIFDGLLQNKKMGENMKVSKKSIIQFDFAKVVELSDDELKTKVIGGQSLSAAEQYEIAQKAARGDYSGLEKAKSSEVNNILSYGDDSKKTESGISPSKKTSVTVETPKSTPSVSVKTKTETESAKKTGTSYSNNDYEKKDYVVKTSNIDEREKRDGGSISSSSSTSISTSSSSSTSSSTSTSNSTSSSTSSSNTSPYPFKKTAELNKESDQQYEMEVDYTKNGNNELAVTVRTQNPDGTYDYSHGKVMSKIYHNVTNKVKTPQQRGNPVLYNGYYYYPQQMPDGTWNITGVEYKDDKELFGTFAIRTDANVEVTEYDKTGTEIIGTTIDSGFLIHGGISPTTWGCLKMPDEKNLWNFAGLTNFILDNGGSASMKVMDYNLLY